LGFQGAGGGLSCLRFVAVEALSPQGIGASWVRVHGLAQQVGQRDAPPGGGFEVLVFIRVERLCLSSVSGAPLTNTLGLLFMPHLCKVLNQSAKYVHDWLKKQPSVKEESLTDWILFDISEKSPKVRYRMFSRHEEARSTGADWEWWFVSNNKSLRLRVQAKKAQGTKDLYSEIARTNQHGLQIDKLLADAKKQNAIPLYAFFSSEIEPTLCRGQNPVEGVYLASATRVYGDFIVGARSKVEAKDVLAISNPLSCITCCPLSQREDELPLNYFREYFPEEFVASENSNESIGIHNQIPNYVQALLSRDFAEQGEMEDSFEIPNEFKALLVFDLRS